MRRLAPIARSGSKQEDIRKDFSAGQLQSVGAVALAWNEIEFMLDVVLYSGLSLSGSAWLDVLTRLTTDGKSELIESAYETLAIPEELRQSIQPTFRTLKELQLLRNSVVHARIYDAVNGIGENIRRGGKVWQVLLTEAALNNLYSRLVVLRDELRSVLALFDIVRNGMSAGRAWEQLSKSDDVKSLHERLKNSQTEQAELAKAMPAF